MWVELSLLALSLHVLYLSYQKYRDSLAFVELDEKYYAVYKSHCLLRQQMELGQRITGRRLERLEKKRGAKR